jgi:hypothetical protein
MNGVAVAWVAANAASALPDTCHRRAISGLPRDNLCQDQEYGNDLTHCSKADNGAKAFDLDLPVTNVVCLFKRPWGL